MTDVLDISNELAEGLRSLRDVLQASSATEHLSVRVPPYTADESDLASFPLQMAFVGQYSAGKSTLINALTGADLPTGAGVVTEKVTEVAWRGVRLVDTPGVQTGTREDHDARAQRAYESADLIIFVTTTQLLDAAGHDLLHELAGRQRKSRQIVMVVNKAGRDHASPDAITDAVRQAMMPYEIPIVLCDAKDHLLALSEADQELRDDLLEDANLDELRSVLTRQARDCGVMARLSTPARAAIAVCAHAVELAQDRADEAEARHADLERALASFARALDQLEEGAGRIANELHRRIEELADEPCVLILEGETADDGSKLHGLIEEADERIEQIQQEAISSLDELVESVSARLHADGQTIVESGELARLSARRDAAAVPVSRTRSRSIRLDWAAELRQEVKSGLSSLLEVKLPTGSRPGGDLHRLVHRIKRMRHGSDIRPWSVVRSAEKIERLSKFVNALSKRPMLQRVASEAGDVVVDEFRRMWSESQRKRQSDALRASFREAAASSKQEFAAIVDEITGTINDAASHPRQELTVEAAASVEAKDTAQELAELHRRFERLEECAQGL